MYAGNSSASASKPFDTLVMLDMHGTAFDSDIQMLWAVTHVINESFRKTGEKFNDYESCIEWLKETYNFSTQRVLEGSKEAIFKEILSNGNEDNHDIEAKEMFGKYDKILETFLIDAIKEDLPRHEQDRVIIPAGFESCVRDLHSKDIILGFASNSSTDFLKNVLGEMGILQYFNQNAIIGSNKHKKDKTGGAIERAVNDVNGCVSGESGAAVQPVKKVVFVGDADSDRQCLEGFKERNPEITAEFIMMSLPTRKFTTAKVQEQKESSEQQITTCQGFNSLSSYIDKNYLQEPLRYRL